MPKLVALFRVDFLRVVAINTKLEKKHCVTALSSCKSNTLTTILLSSVLIGLVILMMATPKLQRIPNEMRNPIEERMAIWYRFDMKASQQEQLGSSKRS